MDSDQAKASLFCMLTDIARPWVKVSFKLADLSFKRIEEFELDIDVNNKPLLETVLKTVWRSFISRGED